MDGIVNIYKPLGITSHDVIYKVRRILGIKKVGHTGTLDPEACGVLPVCVGKGTKLAGFITEANKEYKAVIRLGITTDTQDATGNILTESEPNISFEEFSEVVSQLIGEIYQLPPMYSAIKINGKKLCNLARKGIEVEREPRKITVYNIEISDFNGETAVLDIKCSKGTYIYELFVMTSVRFWDAALLCSRWRERLPGSSKLRTASPSKNLQGRPKNILCRPKSFFKDIRHIMRTADKRNDS